MFSPTNIRFIHILSDPGGPWMPFGAPGRARWKQKPSFIINVSPSASRLGFSPPASGLGSGSSLMCRRLAWVMMRSVEKSLGGGAVSLLWTLHVFASVAGVVSSVGFMVELLGIRWVCAV